MKKLLLLLLFVSILFCENIIFESSYDTAIKKATQNNKHILAVVTRNDCPWCEKFKKNTLLDKTVARLINKNFIPLMLNKDINKIPNHIMTKVTPVTFFLTKDGKRIFTIRGYESPVEFAKDIRNILNRQLSIYKE